MRALTMALAVAALSSCASAPSTRHGGHAPPEPIPSRPVGDNEHLVHSGDTVYSIAFRNSLDYRELAKWNKIGSDYLIFPGQILRLTPPGPPPKPPPPPKIQVNEDMEADLTPIERAPPPQPITAQTPTLEQAVIQPLPGEIVEPSGFEWTWPTNGTVLRGYAPGDGSKGLDFTGAIGQPVFAAAPGRVVYSGNALKGYGELIIIKHDDVHLSAYGYNRKRYVQEGDIVTVGQVIGEMGLGPENKPVLHFEIRERGKPTDPAALLPAKGTRRVAG